MLTRTESGLAFDIENDGNTDTGSLFDHMIGIIKLLAKPSGQDPSDRRLARTHHSDEKNVTGYAGRRFIRALSRVSCHYAILTKAARIRYECGPRKIETGWLAYRGFFRNQSRRHKNQQLAFVVSLQVLLE